LACVFQQRLAEMVKQERKTSKLATGDGLGHMRDQTKSTR
jgi:hypothetical protein